jgi:hypothetical protein
MTLAQVMEWLIEAYAVAGMLFAPAFLARGVVRMDPQARGSSTAFRLVLAPGTILLWPLLARRWASGVDRPPEERTAHRCPGSRKGGS